MTSEQRVDGVDGCWNELGRGLSTSSSSQHVPSSVEGIESEWSRLSEEQSKRLFDVKVQDYELSTAQDARMWAKTRHRKTLKTTAGSEICRGLRRAQTMPYVFSHAIWAFLWRRSSHLSLVLSCRDPGQKVNASDRLPVSESVSDTERTTGLKAAMPSDSIFLK